MQHVILIHGCGGGELFFGDANGEQLWLKSFKLAIHSPFPMQLNVPNTGAIKPPGEKLVAGFGLSQVYPGIQDVLDKQLVKHGWVTIQWGYDWRQDPYEQSKLLADFIVANYKTSSPCILACHSLGGIVARLAYKRLVDLGKQILVQRVICCGTPHYGLFLIGEIWTHSVVDDAVNSNGNFILEIFAKLAKSTGVKDRVAAITATWPAFYCLLPSLTDPKAPLDPNRASMYSSTFWPSYLNVYQPYLDYAKGFYQTQLAIADSVPRGRRLVNLCGVGFDTPWTTPPIIPNRPQNFEWDRSDNGDGSVMLDSAALAGADNYTTKVPHQDLLVAAAQSGFIRDRVLEEIDYDSPPVSLPGFEDPAPFRNLPVDLAPPATESNPDVELVESPRSGKFNYRSNQFSQKRK